MRIPEHNWETGCLEPREYPNELFEPLLVWLLTTSAWHEDPERVERKVLSLKRAMADYRQPPQSHQEADVFRAREASELEEKAAQINRAEALKQQRRENLAKARAAKQAKKELQHA